MALWRHFTGAMRVGSERVKMVKARKAAARDSTKTKTAATKANTTTKHAKKKRGREEQEGASAGGENQDSTNTSAKHRRTSSSSSSSVTPVVVAANTPSLVSPSAFASPDPTAAWEHSSSQRKKRMDFLLPSTKVSAYWEQSNAWYPAIIDKNVPNGIVVKWLSDGTTTVVPKAFVRQIDEEEEEEEDEEEENEEEKNEEEEDEEEEEEDDQSQDLLNGVANEIHVFYIMYM
jgi:hypothetical protein